MVQGAKFSDRDAEVVFIIDDDQAVCGGLRNLLESAGLHSKSFNSTEEFMSQWTIDQAGCLLLDVQLPGMTGVDFQEKLSRSGIEIPIVFMTGHATIPIVRKAMKAGAVDFLTKPLKHRELLSAIDGALEIDRKRRDQDVRLNSIRMRFQSLSSREREVLERINSGLLNKEIAVELNLRIVTVKFHRQHVMEKMHADSLAELIRMYGLLNGSIQLSSQSS